MGIFQIMKAYIHPNHSGDVTSVSDGAQAIVDKQAVTFSNPIYSSQAQSVIAAGGAPTVNLKNDASNAMTGIETTWTDSDLKIPTSKAMATKVSSLISAANPIPIAVAAGTVDAITATFSPAITLVDMRVCMIVAAGANLTTTPTFAPDGLTLHTIVKKGGAALVAGDIPGALAVCILEYNLANTRWELLNPAMPCYQ